MRVLPVVSERVDQETRRQDLVERRVLDDLREQRLIGPDAFDAQRREAFDQSGLRELARRTEADDLREHRVVVRRDRAPGVDAAVDAQARRARLFVGGHAAERGAEAFVGHLGINPGLDRPAGADETLLRHRQRQACRGADLLLDEIDRDAVGPHCQLGHRMLDLQARVHLEEIRFVVAGLENEFDRARRVVADGATELQRGIEQLRAHSIGQMSRGRLLDHLLVVALDGALALEQMDEVAVSVAEQLHFEMTRPFDEAFEQHAVVAERSECFAARGAQPGRERGRVVDALHALAAAARAGLDQQREADVTGRTRQCIVALLVVVVPGHARHAGFTRDALALDLRAHAGNGLAMRADEDDAFPRAGIDQFELLGQEAVAGMDRVDAMCDGGRDDGFGIEIGRACRCGSDADRDVGLADVTRVGVGIGVHGDRADAEPPAGADDTARDLAAVGDEKGVKHREAHRAPSRCGEGSGRGRPQRASVVQLRWMRCAHPSYPAFPQREKEQTIRSSSPSHPIHR